MLQDATIITPWLKDTAVILIEMTDFTAALYTPIKNDTEDKCAHLPQKTRLNLESLTSHWKLKGVSLLV